MHVSALNNDDLYAKGQDLGFVGPGIRNSQIKIKEVASGTKELYTSGKYHSVPSVEEEVGGNCRWNSWSKE